MPTIDDHDYFLQRAQQERAIAAAARDGQVAKAHLQMAEEYERRAAAYAAAAATEKPLKR